MASLGDHVILWGALFFTGTFIGFMVTWILMQGAKVRF